MKKILIVTAVVLSFASTALAAPTALATNTVSNAGVSLYGAADATAVTSATSVMAKLSTGVKIVANYTTAGYGIFTKHLKGSKVFGTAFDSSAISWTTATAGTDITTTNSGSATAVPSGWTTM